MKKIVSFILVAALAVGALALAGCKDKVPGPTEVDYGSAKYIEYTLDPDFTFWYLDCFTQSSDEGDTFVANTDDNNGVLMFEVGTLDESRPYANVAAYTDDEAKAMLRIALGLVSSQNADYEYKDFEFTVGEYIHMYMYVVATYHESGEIQSIYIEKFILPNSTVYTLHSFIPSSAIEKYGVPFKDAALTASVPVVTEEPVAVVPENYTHYTNGLVSFDYCGLFSGKTEEGSFMLFGTTGAALMYYEIARLKDGYSYEGMTALSDEELTAYIAVFSGLTPDSVETLTAVDMGGYIRIDIVFRTVGATACMNAITTQFILADGTTHTIVGYMAEEQLEFYPQRAITNINFTPAS